MPQRILLASLCVTLALALFFPHAAMAQYNVSTVAGGGPNNLPAQQVGLGYPVSVALDSHGNLYIADSYSSQIFEISNGTTCSTCTITLVAGNGTIGYSGDGDPATSAALSGPEGVFVDGFGNIFIADSGNNVIREVVASTGNISTVAGGGSGCVGQTDSLGDGCPATSAQLNDPYGVFVDGNGNIFIADTDNSVIREVVASSGNISTVAGNFTAGSGYSGDNGAATSAQLSEPQSVYLDATGNIFIADTLNSVIRAVNPGTASTVIAGVTIPAGDINTVAGTNYKASSGTACQFTGDNGAATSAYFCLPGGVFVDGSENIYIADTDNYAIREVSSSGTITTVAGTPGSFGYAGNGAAATSALLNYPSSMTVDGSGDIFIADTDNFVVREVTGGNIQAFAGNNTRAFSGDGGPATSAALDAPGGVFVDGAGNVYIADTDNSAIRVFNPGTQAVTIAGVTIQPGDIETVAGDGTFCALPAPGGCGDGGAAPSAQLNFPYGVFVDGSGHIYIADTGAISQNSVIRVVNGGTTAVTIAGVAIQPGFVETVAGTLGTVGFAGDGGAPTSAQLYDPQAVTLDASGNIYIADTVNNAVRVVNTGTAALTIGAVTVAPGTINTVAGTPPTSCNVSGCGDNGPANAAYLNFPTGISVDASGNIYIADSQNSAVRVVNPSANPVTIAGTTIPAGDILTVAGTLGRDGYTGDNGPPASALLNNPGGVFVDSLGNIFIADSSNSAVREVVAADSTIETLAGNGVGTAGFSGDGGPASSAALNTPGSVALGAGNIYIADTENMRIRQLISTVTISVAPASTTVPIGGTQQFLATVNGATNANVTWQVNAITGGNSTVGTISTAGLYQAPSAVPSSAVTVTAISDANGTTSASATVTVAASGVPAISVSTTPAGVTVVYTSALQTFTANVTGETNTAVNWLVSGAAGGNATVGTIDTSGNYTAPSSVPTPALVTISAVSQADSTVSGTYPITIVTLPTAQQPASQTIGPGGTANFSLALNANTGSPHHPITLSCLQSSLPAGATCTFSPATITPGSSLVSFNLAVTVPTGSGAQLTPRTTWLAVYLAFSPLAGILLLAGRRKRRGVGLAVLCFLLVALVACGGGSGNGSSSKPVTYNIQVQGTTAAQPTPVKITTVTLTVQ